MGLESTLLKASHRRTIAPTWVADYCHANSINVERRARHNAYYVILHDYVNVKTNVFVSSNENNVWLKAMYFLEKRK